MKLDSTISVFLITLINSPDHVFHRTPVYGCFSNEKLGYPKTSENFTAGKSLLHPLTIFAENLYQRCLSGS